MKKYIMMVDVDSTLYDADALFSKVAMAEGHDWYPKKSYQWFRADGLGVPQETLTNLFRKCHSKEWVEVQKPYKGSVEVLNGFMDKYEDLVVPWYVSSRHPMARGPLAEWIVEKGFPLIDDDHVIATMNKKEWLLENKPAIVIDDRVQTILFSRYEIGAHVLSLVHNHNTNLVNEVDGVWMCEDWFEIGFKLDNPVMKTIGVTHPAKRKSTSKRS